VNLDKGGSEVGEGVGNADGVRSEHTDFVITDQGDQFRLQLFAFLVRVGEALGDDDGGADAVAHTRAKHVEHMVASDDDDGEVDRFDEIIEARIDAVLGRGLHVRIDDENITRVAEVLKRRQHTDRAGNGVAGKANDGDSAGREKEVENVTRFR